MRARRWLSVSGAFIALALTAAACGSDSADTGADTSESGGSAAESGGATPDLKGKTVTIFSSIRDVEADRLAEAWKPFEEATGVTIKHEGSAKFEDELKVRVAGGNAPDLAFIPQPGLLGTLAKQGKVQPAEDLKADVQKNNGDAWVGYGTVDGKFYAPPFGANIKSLVWYSPKAFADKKYAIPTTWDEMVKLSDKIVADGGTPWCAGIESGGATGWPMTDWMEDAMLRVNGEKVYDQWVNHQIPFNDPKVKAAGDLVAGVILNPKYVGNVKAIATTPFQQGGLGILDGKCYMHRQASFYGNQFPDGTTKGPDGQVNAFFLPMLKSADPKAMLGGGELIGAFSDKPEVKAVQKYLTSLEYAQSRAKIGNWLSPHKELDPAVYTDPLEKNFATLLKDSPVFRFDGSDLMPAAVGAGTFWKGMTSLVAGEKDLPTVLNEIESSWPK